MCVILDDSIGILKSINAYFDGHCELILSFFSDQMKILSKIVPNRCTVVIGWPETPEKTVRRYYRSRPRWIIINIVRRVHS